MVQENFLHTITNMLGFSVKQREVISDDGYDTIYTIINWKYDKIRKFCTTNSNLTTTRRENSYGDQKIKCLQALAWWVTNLTLRGQHIFLADFDAFIMEDYIDEAKLDYEDGKKYPYTKKPDKFSNSK